MTNKRTIKGAFIGTVKLSGIEQGQGDYKVFYHQKHFSLAYDGKFIRHIKKAVLRSAGVFLEGKKIYNQLGYVGCEKK